MNIKAPVIAALLVALPATALAAHDDHHGSAPARAYSAPARSYSAPARSYSPPQRTYSAPQRTYSAPRRTYSAPQRSYAPPRNVQPMPRYQARTFESARTYAYAAPHYVAHRYVSDWGWNGGRVWVASPGYWGGGFWGLFAVNVAFDTGPSYYAVAPSSPGAQLLANYGLQQTDCDQPNLVDIYGPDGSEICAYPNDEVGPGTYNVDPATLTLVSA